MSTTTKENWKSDGLDSDGKATWSVQDDDDVDNNNTGSSAVLLCMNVSGGSPMNVACSEPPHMAPSSNIDGDDDGSVSYYFQVELLQLGSRSSLSVGVVRPSEFQKGYKTKGMFYNGNLTNGSAALELGYGPYLRQGDSIVVEHKSYNNNNSSRRVQVKFHVNGICLGTAFEIPTTAEDEAFVPALHGMGDIRVRITFLSGVPAPSSSSSSSTTTHPLMGKWTVTQAWDDNDGGNTLPIWPVEGTGDKAITLSMEPRSPPDQHNSWRLVLKAANTMQVIKQVGATRADKNTFELVSPDGSPTGAMSTMMMPRPPFSDMEPKLSRALATKWHMIYVGTDGTTAEVRSSCGQILAKLERIQRNMSRVACASYKT